LNAALYDTQNTGYLPKVISISAGGGRSPNSYSDTVDDLLAAAVTLGVTVCVSSGDWGGYNYPNSLYYRPYRQFNACWPASNPYVLSVGGTSLALKPDGSISSQIVWNNNGNDYYITGGNLSSDYYIPSYQIGLTITPMDNYVAGSPTAFTSRATPDVALVADPNTGITLYYGTANNYLNKGGGTSLSAPLFAGLIARINQITRRSVGFVNEIFYRNPGAFTDILPQPIFPGFSVDSNQFEGKGFMTTSGWDATTGLGTPKGAEVLALFQTPEVSITGAWNIGPGWSL
jgi:kumamolisin